jgi:hypothetical protein
LSSSPRRAAQALAAKKAKHRWKKDDQNGLIWCMDDSLCSMV